jgi:hypothetical protein
MNEVDRPAAQRVIGERSSSPSVLSSYLCERYVNAHQTHTASFLYAKKIRS